MTMISDSKRETYVEAAVTQIAKLNGWLSFKWASPGNRGVPDRLYFRNGETVMVEFKTRNGRLSGLQKAQIKRLRAAGMTVHVINTVEGAELVFA